MTYDVAAGPFGPKLVLYEVRKLKSTPVMETTVYNSLPSELQFEPVVEVITRLYHQ